MFYRLKSTQLWIIQAKWPVQIAVRRTMPWLAPPQSPTTRSAQGPSPLTKQAFSVVWATRRVSWQKAISTSQPCRRLPLPQRLLSLTTFNTWRAQFRSPTSTPSMALNQPRARADSSTPTRTSTFKQNSNGCKCRLISLCVRTKSPLTVNSLQLSSSLSIASNHIWLRKS